MEYKISKELFEEVITSTSITQNTITKITTKVNSDKIFVYYLDGMEEEYRYVITYNDFFFKCKEWALSRGYIAFSAIDGCYFLDEQGNTFVFEERGVNEQQSLFNACEWILKESK